MRFFKKPLLGHNEILKQVLDDVPRAGKRYSSQRINNGVNTLGMLLFAGKIRSA